MYTGNSASSKKFFDDSSVSHPNYLGQNFVVNFEIYMQVYVVIVIVC